MYLFETVQLEPYLQMVVMLDTVTTVSFVFVVSFYVVHLTFAGFVLVVVRPCHKVQLCQMRMRLLLALLGLVNCFQDQIAHYIFVVLCFVLFDLSHLKHQLKLVVL